MADTRIDELRRRLERDPGSRLFAQLAEELRKSGDLAEAIRVARAGLAVHTTYASARLTLGRALLDSGEPSGARVELESALRDAPDNILASRYLAQARESLGDLSGAAEQLRKTLQMAPGDKQLETALAAVELRIAASAPAADAHTTPPTPRRVPPPLPLGASPTAPGAPPVSVAATPAVAAPEPKRLAPTLRIPGLDVAAASSQAPPPAPMAAPVATATAAIALDATVSDAPDVTFAQATLPGGTTAPLGAMAPAAIQEPAMPGGAAAPFSSSTLAELYYQQGLVDRAVEVYRQLLQQEPQNEKARARLAQLEAAAPPVDRSERRKALERTIAGLELLLGAVRRR